MSLYSIKDTTLTAIGDAIREKTGATDTYTPAQMATAIQGITGGGGDFEPIVLTGNQEYGCCGQIGTAMIKLYGDKISTKNITTTSNMFARALIDEVPFDINLSSETFVSVAGTFAYSKLKKPPLIKGDLQKQTGTYNGAIAFSSFFAGSERMTEIDKDYFNYFGTNYWESSKQYGSSRARMFSSCYSLRNIPDLSNLVNTPTSYSNALYYSGFTDCYVLDEIVDLPVYENLTVTSNMFYNCFAGCMRLKKMTFVTNPDGSPKVAPGWTNQTIDLSGAGVFSSDRYILNYSEYTGITNDTRVTNSTEYHSLKLNPDWWTTDRAFSRYNGDCAIATINSLPDVSASGGTNTIKFRGEAGSSTEGGAIQDIGQKYIDRAAQKGWTVVFV